MNLTIKYGILDNNIDVTKIALEKCVQINNYLYIPDIDVIRASIFTDPLYGIKKSIFIYDNSLNMNEYTDDKKIYIDIETNKIYVNENPTKIIYLEKLRNIHTKLKIDFGNFNEEFPEQLMAATYLTGNEKILEIGGNIGRNSLIIAYILNNTDNFNFVSLESDPTIALQLVHNKTINNLHFHVEASALSKRKLIQKEWDTICSDELLEGYKSVNIITLPELYNKYKIEFDTLILDCEGAFYYILMDMPEILDNIKLIIMENDYWDISKKEYVDNILKKNNFYVDYVENGGWGPCFENFFEVWKKFK